MNFPGSAARVGRDERRRFEISGHGHVDRRRRPVGDRADVGRDRAGAQNLAGLVRRAGDDGQSRRQSGRLGSFAGQRSEDRTDRSEVRHLFAAPSERAEFSSVLM